MVTLKKGFFVVLLVVFLASSVWAVDEARPATETKPPAAKPATPVQPATAPAAKPAIPAPATPAPVAPAPTTPAPVAPAAKEQPQQPTSPVVTEEAKAAQPQFPYVAEIIGTEVYLRSGPGTAYYHCGKLSAPQRVNVIGFTHDNWFQVLPPPGSFSWISKNFVELDKSNPKKGTVTGDAVRVWAGSDFVEPMRSSSLQTKLNKGAAVQLIGVPEGEGDYYKIAPPADAYLWISGDSLKALKKEEPKPEPKEAAPAVTKGEEQAKPETPEVEKEEPKPVAPPRPSKAREYLKQCYDISAKLDEEVKKPAPEQKYDAYKKMLEPILADPNEAGASIEYARYLSDRIKRYEAAISAGDQLKEQEEKLAEIRKQIDEARKEKIEKIAEKLEQYVMTGILKPSYVYSGQAGPRRYLLTNDQGRVIAYVTLSSESMAGYVENLFNKKVGIVGRIVNSPKELITLVVASKIEEQK